jgi:hypothetical protein
VQAPEGAASFVDPSVKFIREAFDTARNRRYDLACSALQEAVNSAIDDVAKGYLKLQLAEYEHHRDPARAQEILLSAASLNRQIVKPMTGIGYAKLSSPTGSQAASATEFMRRFLEPNDLIIFVNALLEDLSWGEEGSKRFEAAIRDLGFLLGFGSQRPEVEAGKGPDNLWAIGGLRYFVIECKSGTTGEALSKSDCNQLIGSMAWFTNTYDATCAAIPLMVHPLNRFDRHSSPTSAMRIIETSALEKLKQAVRGHAAVIASAGRVTNSTSVASGLAHFGLTSSEFINRFSVGFSIER